MISFLDLPVSKDQARVYVYTATNGNASLTDSASYQGAKTWNKPPGISFVYGLLIGAGSGGGGGGGGAVGNGGGGGAAGKMISFLQPACLVPESLVVTVGVGGAGGAGGVSSIGQRGQSPLVETALYFNNVYTSASVLLGTGSLSLSYVNTGNARGTLLGGRAGGVPTNQHAAGGINENMLIASQSGICGFSLYNISEVVSTGSSGGSGSAGFDVLYTGYPQGGAGGGGININTATSYNGGSVLCPSTSNFSIWNRNLTGIAPGGNGDHGVTLFKPTFFTLPGAGGAGRNTGTGGRGGDGGLGCGGGGGGGGGSFGGVGGRGGDGLVILVCW